MKINARQFNWNGDTGTAFTTDIFGLESSPQTMLVKGDRKDLVFTRSKRLYHGEREDAEFCGWEYTCNVGFYKIHIIND